MAGQSLVNSPHKGDIFIFVSSLVFFLWGFSFFFLGEAVAPFSLHSGYFVFGGVWVCAFGRRHNGLIFALGYGTASFVFCSSLCRLEVGCKEHVGGRILNGMEHYDICLRLSTPARSPLRVSSLLWLLAKFLLQGLSALLALMPPLVLLLRR